MGGKGVSRTVVRIKASLYLNIPSQLAQLYGISEGDKLEWSQDGPGELRIRKVSSK
jgi:bifunctional DNA-binding transcriptional regulator/antitoxin component of YhaV-PrlF toxin-antitoxin module